MFQDIQFMVLEYQYLIAVVWILFRVIWIQSLQAFLLVLIMQLLLYLQRNINLNIIWIYQKILILGWIWDSNAVAVPGSRSGVIGTAFIAGVCSTYKYSIVEYAGLNSISNTAHELGHR